jgi:hypothetical protein
MTWKGPPRCLRATHPVSAFLVVLLWGATPVLSVLHATEQGHRYCTEHGAVEDAQAAGAADRASRTGAVASTLTAERAPRHEGCAFARYCQIGRLPEPHAPTAPRVLDVPAALDAAPATPPASISVLRLAPKTSPPV